MEWPRPQVSGGSIFEWPAAGLLRAFWAKTWNWPEDQAVSDKIQQRSR